ncbi:MAG: saccharopine dehydrogenase family protein [Planctomycetota bacterium]|jgi:saccharopine dehydrogenase-like NADP-dependent oxidoreductase
MARILVLGSGMVGSAMALDLAATHDVTATDRDVAALQRLEGKSGISTLLLDVSDQAALCAAVQDMDLVISAVPGCLGFATLRTLIEAGRNVADISFFPEESLDLDALAKEREVVVVTDIGVAPGLHNLIFGWHDTRMEIHRYTCMVGGIPKQRDFPWEYKAPFSPADVIEEYLRPSRLVEGGKMVVKPALSESELVEFAEVGKLEAFNTDGLRTLIRTMPHVPDMSEKTLRYPGHRDLALALRESGFLSEQPVRVGGKEVVPREVTSAILFDQWKLGPEEEELTVMRVTVEGLEDGKQVTHIWQLHDVYDAATRTSSMARTTGYTCTAMAEMMLSGAWDQPGVAPGEVVGRAPGVFEQVRAYLAERGVVLRHEAG